MSRSDLQIPSYLWAIGSTAAKFTPNQLVLDRYNVIAPQIWQDRNTLTGQHHRDNLTYAPEELPASTIPYLALFPHRLHLPVIYSICFVKEAEIILLENVPFTENGQLLPTLTESWQEATPVRQLYWLWQILELWQPLMEQRVGKSLCIADNLHVEGWLVRLRELYPDEKTPSLGQLGTTWSDLVEHSDAEIAPQLEALIQQLQTPESKLKDVQTNLNQLLLSQASQQPLGVSFASSTDLGVKPNHNEDSHYPTAADVEDPLSQYLAIVCDGIGGHEGGEVASQLAVQTLTLQIRAILVELEVDPEPMTPQMVADQLNAVLRVVNNLICARNNEQEREHRQRMATTVVMALQLPQRVLNSGSDLNSHELYLAHVGDSRAYWLTAESCHLLTVDHDVTNREVRMARSLYREALQRPDAIGLTQALGTRDAESLRPTIQRFILEEDGLLLLCSDGLSDHQWVEESWRNFVPQVLGGELSLEATVKDWIAQAKEQNEDDNISLVLTAYRVSPLPEVVVSPAEVPNFELVQEIETQPIPEPMLSAIVPLLAVEKEELAKTESPEPIQARPSWVRMIAITFTVMALITTTFAVGLIAQQWFFPSESETEIEQSQ